MAPRSTLIPQPLTPLAYFGDPARAEDPRRNRVGRLAGKAAS